MFKISNLVLGGKEILMSLCSSLERGEKEREWGPVGGVQGFVRVATRKQRYLSESIETTYSKFECWSN